MNSTKRANRTSTPILGFQMTMAFPKPFNSDGRNSTVLGRHESKKNSTRGFSQKFERSAMQSHSKSTKRANRTSTPHLGFQKTLQSTKPFNLNFTVLGRQEWNKNLTGGFSQKFERPEMQSHSNSTKRANRTSTPHLGFQKTLQSTKPFNLNSTVLGRQEWNKNLTGGFSQKFERPEMQSHSSEEQKRESDKRFYLRGDHHNASKSYKQTTLTTVEMCPQTNTEIDQARIRMGCGKDLYGKDKYMCVPNEGLTALKESCANGPMGLQEKGYCPVVTNEGKVIQKNCRDFKSGCPEKYYSIADPNKYKACQQINTDLGCYYNSPNCSTEVQRNSNKTPVLNFITESVYDRNSTSDPGLLSRHHLSVQMTVQMCPRTETEIKKARMRMGCGKDIYGKDRYLCAPNEKLTALKELCVNGVMGIQEEGKCSAVTDEGKVIPKNCKDFSSGCPEVVYFIATFYEYPACQMINGSLGCYQEDPQCHGPERIVRSHKNLITVSSTSMTSEPGTKIYLNGNNESATIPPISAEENNTAIPLSISSNQTNATMSLSPSILPTTTSRKNMFSFSFILTLIGCQMVIVIICSVVARCSSKRNERVTDTRNGENERLNVSETEV